MLKLVIGTFYRHSCPKYRYGRPQWLPRSLVHLCIPFLDPVFVYYTYQSESQSGYGQNGLCTTN